jgi:proteic killer suppression protein
VIRSFADDATSDLFHGTDSKAARHRISKTLWAGVRRKLDMLDSATRLEQLRVPPGNHLEPLKGARAGFHSIRINDQYRIVFRCEDEHCYDVRCEDYHH